MSYFVFEKNDSHIPVDGFVKASPANERAVLETVAALRREGHECIELDWPFGMISSSILSFSNN
jgi:NADH:ubiquinone oxidoreductase subunit B-like Fe-S oxidoreductase